MLSLTEIDNEFNEEEEQINLGYFEPNASRRSKYLRFTTPERSKDIFVEETRIKVIGFL